MTDIDAILADFRTWLEANDEPPAERIDTGAIVAQFAALRHEVNLQTKASRAIAERAEKASDEIHPAVKSLLELCDVLGNSEKQLRKTPMAIEMLIPDSVREAIPDWHDHEFKPSGFFTRWFRQGIEGQVVALRNHMDEITAMHNRKSDVIEAMTKTITEMLESAADGYAMSLRRIEAALPTFGVVPIPVLGETFDPHTMEVVDTGGDGPSGTVTEELRRGYTCNGKILRYAQVRVAA